MASSQLCARPATPAYLGSSQSGASLCSKSKKIFVSNDNGPAVPVDRSIAANTVLMKYGPTSSRATIHASRP